MARSVTFNGTTRFAPGAMSRIDATGMTQQGVATNGIIGLIGESQSGPEPGTVITIDDPALATTLLKDGPLANAVRMAFGPSNDERVPGAAFRVLAVRANQALQSSAFLWGRVAEHVTSGASTATDIVFPALSFTANEHNGNILRIYTLPPSDPAFDNTQYEEREITGTAATTLTVSPGFSAAPAGSTLCIIFAKVAELKSTDYSALANSLKQKYRAGTFAGQEWVTSYEGQDQESGDIGGKALFELEYIGQNQQIVFATGAATGGSTTTFVRVGAFVGVNACQFFFVHATGGALPTPVLRKIASNTADEITVALMLATGSGATFSVRKDMFFSGALTVDAAAGTVTLPATIDVALNELADLVIVMTSGVAEGAQRSITSNTAGISSVLTLDYPWEAGKIPEATDTFQLRYVMVASATVAGSNGVAKTFSTSVSSNGGATTPDIAITFTASQTVVDLVNYINQNYPNYRAYVTSGANPRALVSTLDHDDSALNVDLRNDRKALKLDPNYTEQWPLPWANRFRADLEALVQDINVKNAYVTAERVTGNATGIGAGRPEFYVSPSGDDYVYLSGGSQGESLPSNWQDAFDTLARVRCNHVVPLISADIIYPSGGIVPLETIAAQFATHLRLTNGVLKSERGGYMGISATKTKYIEWLNNFNNTDIQLVAQKIKFLNMQGEVAWHDEWALAVIAAGMRSGMPEVGEPLTWKYINTSGISQDASWDPNESTDYNVLVQNGALFVEYIEGQGYRWFRDLTTYVQSDNLAYTDGNVRDTLRNLSYYWRKTVEDLVTGRKGKGRATVTDVKSTSTAFFEDKKAEFWIVDSEDEQGNPLNAYRNLRVSQSGDIIRARVTVTPAVGINFELLEIFVELPRASA